MILIGRGLDFTNDFEINEKVRTESYAVQLSGRGKRPEGSLKRKKRKTEGTRSFLPKTETKESARTTERADSRIRSAPVEG